MNKKRLAILTIAALLVGATISLLVRTPQPSAGHTELVIVGFGGTYQDLQKRVLFDPFAESVNVNVRSVAYSGEYGQLAANIRAKTNNWDVVQVESSFLLRAAQEELLESIDYDAVGDVGLLPRAKHPYGVAHIGWSTVLCWNTERIPEDSPAPASWNALWDTESYPGLRELRKTPRGNLELALLADGVPADELYPLDVERALRKLGDIKPLIDWWTSGAESQQKLLGSATLGALWNGRVWALRRDGKPVAMSLAQQIVDYDWWVIPKGRTNANGELPTDFLRFACSPERQAEIARNYGYAPTVKEAFRFLEESQITDMPTADANLSRGVFFDAQWWAENEEQVGVRWSVWLLE